MSINSTAFAEKPRQEILAKILSDLIWLRLHDASSGTNIPNSGSVSGDLTLSGTEGTFWSANAPLVTMNGTDNYILDTSSATRELCRWDTLGDGDLLIAMDFQWTTAAPTVSEYVLSHTLGGGTGENGFGIKVASGAMVVDIRESGGTTTTIGSLTTSQMSTGVVHHLLIHVDGAGKTVHYYVDGQKSGTDGDWSSTTVPNLIAAHGLAISGRSRSTAPNSLLNAATTPSDSLLGNIFILRSATDISSSIASIASEWAKHRHELPFGLEGI